MFMENLIIRKIIFPEFTDIKCSMMPFIQGDESSLPEIYKPYSEIIKNNFLEKGEIGFLTIHESFVESGKSQRGYNSKGINRNVHIEVGRNNNINRWGSGSGTSWGGKGKTLLDDNTMVLIANSISNTCRLWNTKEMRSTKDGDLSAYIDSYPEHTGFLMQAGELARISIFTVQRNLDKIVQVLSFCFFFNFDWVLFSEVFLLGSSALPISTDVNSGKRCPIFIILSPSLSMFVAAL